MATETTHGIGGLNLSADEVGISAFDLHTKVDIDNSIERAVELTIRPTTTTQLGAGPYDFLIVPDPQKWTAAETLRLSGRVKVVKSSGAGDLDGATDQVSVVNNFFHSLFRSVNIKLNGTELSDPGNNSYPYKSYFEVLLSYSKPTKTGRLQANCFYKDTAEKFDSMTTGSGSSKVESSNEGFKKRRELIKSSQWLYFSINLHSDLTTLRRFIPPNVKIEVNLQRMPDAFCLLSGTARANTLQIVIDDLALKVRRYTPNAKIANYHNRMLAQNGMCFLPVDRSLVKTFTQPQGRYDLSAYNLIKGAVLPDQVIVGLLEVDSYNGSYTKNPFNFKHFNPSEISLVVNGVHEPENGYKLNIGSGDYMQMYNDFLENTGISTDDRDVWIDPADYVGGNFLVVWDRSKEKCNRYHRHIADSGSMDINIRLRETFNSSVVVIVYATYSTDIIIDENFKIEVERL